MTFRLGGVSEKRVHAGMWPGSPKIPYREAHTDPIITYLYSVLYHLLIKTRTNSESTVGRAAFAIRNRSGSVYSFILKIWKDPGTDLE